MQKNLTTKKEIRTYYKNLRNQMEKRQAVALSKKICEKILQWDVYQKAEQIFAYYPLGNEVDLLAVVSHALWEKKRVSFPKTEERGLCFYQVNSLEEFVEGNFHVMEPVSENRSMPGKKSLFFVPGVVFDQGNNRMGFGKGYYDRYFAGKSEEIIRVGIAYEYQILEKIPTDCYDIPMQYLVTECGIR